MPLVQLFRILEFTETFEFGGAIDFWTSIQKIHLRNFTPSMIMVAGWGGEGTIGFSGLRVSDNNRVLLFNMIFDMPFGMLCDISKL